MSIDAAIRFLGIVEKVWDQEARIRIYPEFCAGLKDIENFSHIIVLYWFHLRDDGEERRTLLVTPRRHAGAPQVGVFACRSPTRPNPIGMCVVKLTKVENCTLFVKGLDADEGSPVVDVKPYNPRTDSVPHAKVPKWTSSEPPT